MMNKESIFRILNANKRPETFQKKEKESTLEIILYKYTGLKIVSKVKKVIADGERGYYVNIQACKKVQ